MSEIKPKRDDQMAAGTPKKGLRPNNETKPHGDKLQAALDAISEALAESQQRGKKPH